METVLIAGGAGFIGSHLADRYLSAGYSVICVDNFLSGSRDNLSHLLANPGFTLVEQDVTEPLDKWELPPQKLSAIFHFASPASPNPLSPVSYINHPVETLMVNSVGTKNLLDLAVAQDCQIVLASTSEVYGDPEVHPQPESYWGHVSPNGVRSCYDESKRFLEAIAFSYRRLHQAKIKVLRIFNTYGPRMRLDDGRFTVSLVDSILHDTPFKLYGDGSSTRSFCYISDLVDGIWAVAASDRLVGEVVNLGNDTEFTLKEALSVADRAAGRPLKIEALPALPDDPHRRRPDLTKIKSLLGWEPKVAFAEGFAATLASYRKPSA